MINRPVFMILCHADARLFHRLVGRLAAIGHVVAHVDRKADQQAFEHAAVSFAPDRVDVKWAGYSMVRATLSLLRFALERHPGASHYVLLSGADYPVKRNEEIAAFFAKHRGRNLIKFYDARQAAHSMRSLLNYHFHDYLPSRPPMALKAIRRVAELLARPFKRKLPSGLIPCFGSQWWAVTGECAAYILEESGRTAFWRSFWKHVFAPDEFYFHTLVGNSPFLKVSTGFVPFQGRGTWRLANFHIIHPSLTKVYAMDDYEDIRDAKMMFVRKMASGTSGSLLDRLDSDASHDLSDSSSARLTS